VLQPWEGPFTGDEARLPQHPKVARERREFNRRWREARQVQGLPLPTEEQRARRREYARRWRERARQARISAAATERDDGPQLAASENGICLMIAPREPWRPSPARWRRFPPPGFVRPCEPTLTDRPPAGPGWLHEVKHDGFRILVRKLSERAKVWRRRGADFTDLSLESRANDCGDTLIARAYRARQPTHDAEMTPQRLEAIGHRRRAPAAPAQDRVRLRAARASRALATAREREPQRVLDRPVT
jgi:hypothetical protein